MIDIKLDERCVYAFNAKEKAIYIFHHKDGHLKGPVEGPLGKIEFANEWQLNHFREMLELLINDLAVKKE